eukprot:scaffold3354_cov63-Phaeocystis_antarctica.AAC.2
MGLGRGASPWACSVKPTENQPRGSRARSGGSFCHNQPVGNARHARRRLAGFVRRAARRPRGPVTQRCASRAATSGLGSDTSELKTFPLSAVSAKQPSVRYSVLARGLSRPHWHVPHSQTFVCIGVKLRAARASQVWSPRGRRLAPFIGFPTTAKKAPELTTAGYTCLQHLHDTGQVHARCYINPPKEGLWQASCPGLVEEEVVVGVVNVARVRRAASPRSERHAAAAPASAALTQLLRLPSLLVKAFRE